MRVRLLLAFALVLLAGPASAARAAKRPRHPARTYVPTPENLGKVGGFSPGWTPLEACQERYRDAPFADTAAVLAHVDELERLQDLMPGYIRQALRL